VSPLRLGIVGCGAVAEQYHLPAVAESDEVELVALVDPELERAERLARRYGATIVSREPAELVGAVDAAIVAAPNHAHAPVASELLRAGVHVLVEKPLARTVTECDAIASAAAAGGATAAVGHDFRHFPIATLARTMIADGLLGEVLAVDLRQSTGGRWPYASAYVFSRRESGGGVLIDFGVHMLDLLAWWLGDLRVVAYRDDAAGGVETECEVGLETIAGAPVTIELTRLRPLRDTFVIRCGHGTLEVGIFEPAVIRLTTASGGMLEGDVPDAEFAAAPLRTVFGRQLGDFVAAIRTGREPLVTLAQGRRPVEIVERCYELRGPLRRPWDWPEAYARVEEGAP
jgi:predicted dehydrogenase